MVMKVALLVMAVCAALILYSAWTAPIMGDDYDTEDIGQK